MSAVVNVGADPAAVAAPSTAARSFHERLPGYAHTPVRALPELAAELGLGAVAVKDESSRFGLPAFKVLGAAWAIERAVREDPNLNTLVAASAGNHGRAVARVAAQRGLVARIFLPARVASAHRAAIAGEGAEIVAVAGDYEEAVARAATAGAEPGAITIADVGEGGTADWVIEGYGTLFAELDDQGEFDIVVVPVGVGALAAAAARYGAATSTRVVGVEPATAACLTASLAAGSPTAVPTPRTVMGGLDCGEISPAAWPDLQAGIHGTVTVDDVAAESAMRELATFGLSIGECGAAPLAGLRALATGTDCADLREAVGLGKDSRVVLIATEAPSAGARTTVAASERH